MHAISFLTSVTSPYSLPIFELIDFSTLPIFSLVQFKFFWMKIFIVVTKPVHSSVSDWRSFWTYSDNMILLFLISFFCVQPMVFRKR